LKNVLPLKIYLGEMFFWSFDKNKMNFSFKEKWKSTNK
jgi:hypothetical protein